MESYDLAIIGTGSGNTILDDHYAGKRVAVCEQGTVGGTCRNVGCIATKMFVYAAEVVNTVRNAARYGVDAHRDGVRWPDIVSRVFGRIDPIAAGGEDHRYGLTENQAVAQRFDVSVKVQDYGHRAAAGPELITPGSTGCLGRGSRGCPETARGLRRVRPSGTAGTARAGSGPPDRTA
jgi:mycothione reductase